MSEQKVARELTHQVSVGGVKIGGGAPVVVQSMTNVPMYNKHIINKDVPVLDVPATLEQIRALAAVGCEVVRVSIPNRDCCEPFAEIVKESPLPVVADVHFDYTIAMVAARSGAAGLRINPGNIGGFAKTDAVIDDAGEAGIPIRVGVNAGSLEREIAARTDLSTAEKLALSAQNYIAHFEERGFKDLVISAKAHDVMATVEAYRQISRECPTVPLHLGITEAGTAQQGTIKSSVGLGILLAEGIGDTLRVSLTANPVEEIPVAYGILAAAGVRNCKPELISCPTCSRCQVDLIPIAQQVEARLATINKPISVAVMGCVVNGPGEAKDADVGVACAIGEGVIFAKGQRPIRVDESEIFDALFSVIDTL